MRTLLLLSLAACSPSRQSHTLSLTVTTPDGDRSGNVTGPTNWDLDSLGQPYASWPHASELGADTELGLFVQMYAFQPGSYLSPVSRLYLDGVPQSGNTTLHVERYRFTGSPAFPWEIEGRVEGVFDAGTTIEGGWTTATANCTDVVVRGYGCGLNFPTEAATTQIWEADSWGGIAPCPAEILDHWVDGTTIAIGRDEARVGDAEPLECVITYKNAYTAVCGADDPKIEAEGRTWSAVALAWPGSTYAGMPPQFAVLAGTVDDDTPRMCASQPGTYTHVSGAGLTP